MDYGSLVQWACEDVFPDIREDRKAALIQLASQIRQSPCLRLIECGLEFHHDGSGRVDLLFHTQSRHLDTGGIELPTWWPKLVQASDAPDGSELLGRHQHAVAATPLQDPVDIRPSGWHWLEFDLHERGGARLAGVFQHCHAVAPRDVRTCDRALSHFGKVGCVAAAELRESLSVRRVLQTFGVPIEWGFMVGRADALKLVSPLDGADLPRLDSFGEHAVPRVADSPFRFAVSLDLDLAADRIGERIGVEIAGPAHDREPDTVDANWRSLDAVLQRWGVDESARMSFRGVFHAMPTGVKAQSRLGGLEVFLADELRGFLRLAFHSHVKLVLRPAEAPLLKSYVSLRTIKGGAHDRRRV